MSLIRRIYRILRLAIHFAWGIIMVLVFLGPDPDRRTPRDWEYTTGWMKTACKILGLRIEVTGNPVTAPALLTANHISWHDIVVLQSLVATGFVGKFEIRSWPLIGWLAHHGNTLFIRRGVRDSAEQIKRAIQTRFQDRQNIMLFPEGTTGSGETVLRFRSRLFEAATELHLPLQPICIYYTSPHKHCSELAFIGDETFVHHLLRTLGEPYINVKVHFCPPIQTSGSQDRRMLGQQAEDAVADTLRHFKETLI